MNSSIFVFFDALGRTIIGVKVSETVDTIEVQNPAVLHAGLSDQGKIQVNLIPAFFREFVKDWNAPLVFAYRKSNITVDVGGIELVENLAGQYTSMWSARPPRDEARKAVRELVPTEQQAPAAPIQEPARLNLFDEVKEVPTS